METETRQRMPAWMILAIAILLCAIAYAATFWLRSEPRPDPGVGTTPPALAPGTGG